MPLQWLPLQQRQQPSQTWGGGRMGRRSPVSEALTPSGVRGATGLGGIGFVDRQKEQWAMEDKLKKEERDAKVKEAQEMGMRIRAAAEKEKERGRQMSMQALAGRPAPTEAPALTKENMPEAAKKMWDFILTLDEAGQKFFIKQLKEKELGTGGYIETAGKRKEMPGSLGMYGYLVNQGLLDPTTDTVIKKERVFEKGTFEITDKGVFNTATGEIEIKSEDIPKELTPDDMMNVLKEARAYVTGLVKPGYFESLDAKGREEYLVDADRKFKEQVSYTLAFTYGITTKEATRMANLLPKLKEEDITTEPTPTVPPETNRGLPLDEEVVKGLKELFKADPGELDNIEEYKDKYGEASVDAALKEEKKTPPPKKTTTPSPSKVTIPSKFNTLDKWLGL